ncbi:MAG: hypothetical protein JWN63_1906 [Candidatus Acidoferrum typicum]|nr:hypothetical protein [Candidatus Acidoferrum typicum]
MRFYHSHVRSDVVAAGRPGTNDGTRFNTEFLICRQVMEGIRLETRSVRRNPVKEFIEPKAKSAGRFSKKEFFVLSAAVSVRVWLTCVKRLKRGRIPGGMKPTPWQDRLRGYLHPPITRPDWRWLSTCIGLAAEWGTPGDGPSCRQSHKCWRLPETPTGSGPLLIGDNVEECRNQTCEEQSASLPASRELDSSLLLR